MTSELATDKTRPSAVLFVLGMHRSGTSMLAGSLSNIGFDIGRSVMPAGEDNPQGFYENERLVALHEQALADNGRQWLRPGTGALNPRASIYFTDELIDILTVDFDPHQPWMVKDPRLALTFPLWREALKKLGLRPVFINMLRNPDQVARSLFIRNGITPNWAYHLYRIYVGLNAALLEQEKSEPALTLSFEALLEGPDRLKHEVAGFVAAHFGLTQEGIESVFGNITKPFEKDHRSSGPFSVAGSRYEQAIAQRLHAPDHSGFQRYVADDTQANDFLLTGEGFTQDLNVSEQIQLLKQLSQQNGFNGQSEKEFSDLQRRKAVQELEAKKAELIQLGAKQKELLSELDQASEALEDAKAAFVEQQDAAAGELTSLRDEMSIRQKAHKSEVASLKQTIGSLQQTVDVYAKRPLRQGTKLVAFGAARSGYRAMPLPRNIKEAMARWFRNNIGGRIFPATSLELSNNNDTPKQMVPALNPEDQSALALNLRFPVVDNPDVSIIVPVFNQLDYTLACLQSLRDQQSPWTFEVIVMDDVSSDATEATLREVEGLRYIRNDENLGFVRNCNAGAAAAKGEYLVFLNNDTLVHAGWLSELRQTFDEHANVGIVGSKLIYGDGRLQEVGGIIWEDASGWNVGRLSDPKEPNFNFMRDVDYVSGASLMIPRDLFDQLGRFDLDFVPAYYEDTSLCFAAREAGYRVLCQPLSVVTHFEGISSGTDLGTGVKKHQVTNQQTFRNKWAHVLSSHGVNGSKPHLARDRRPDKHVLIIDATTPTPEEDSGSIDMFNLIGMLLEQGFRVHFVPSDNMAHLGAHTAKLQRLGVLCVYAPFYTSVDDYLSKTDYDFDLVILSRVNIARQEISVLNRWIPHTPRIFYTVDLHFLREGRLAEETGDPKHLEQAKRTRKQELDVMARSDTTIVLSEAEHRLLEDAKVTGVEVLPLLRRFDETTVKSYRSRDGIGFIGGFRHLPNVEAVHFLLDEVWPVVQRQREVSGAPAIPLRIGGSHMPEDLASKIDALEGVENLGFIHDLGDFFDGLRYSIAPLKTGAGLKGKVAESWGHGVPVIGTSIAFEGMPSRPGLKALLLQADKPEDLAALILNTFDEEALWQERSRAAQAYSQEAFGVDRLNDVVRQIIERTSLRAETRTGGKSAKGKS